MNDNNLLAQTLEEHLPYCDIAIGWDRYNQFNHGHVFVAVVDPNANDVIFELVSDLQGGDMDAIFAYDKLKALADKQNILIGVDKNPVLALQKATDSYHERILNS